MQDDHQQDHEHHHDHEHHEHGHDHEHHQEHVDISDVSLATSATLHCLMGCGLGELVGMLIAMALSLAIVPSIVLAVSLGFVFGFILGMRPLLKHGYSFNNAFKQVIIAEGFSILFMETAEVLVEVYTPGFMQAGLLDPILWVGMLCALAAGFIAAWPINFIMVKKGYPHQH